MTDYSFILDGIKYSNSSVNAFSECALQFKLGYIDSVNKIKNFYSEYGTIVHETLEKYFDNTLDIFELTNYFEEHFASISIAPPPFPANLVNNYLEQGREFFDNFSWDRDGVEILFREDYINSEISDGIKIVIKPDLVVIDKKINEIILIDYKTSSIMKNGKIDKKKLEEYKKQMFLYCYVINKVKSIHIDKIRLLFIRYPELAIDKPIEMCYTDEEGKIVVDEFLASISKIKVEQEWKPKPKLDYFCNQLCSVRLSCPLYLNQFGTSVEKEFVPE